MGKCIEFGISRKNTGVFIHLRKNGNLEDELEFREATCGFDVLRTTSISPNEVQAFVRQKNSDMALLVTIIVDDKNPSEVAKFQLDGTELPDDLEIKRMQLPELPGKTKAKLDVLE